MCVVSDRILQCDSSACLADICGLADLRASTRAYLEAAQVSDESMHDSLIVLDALVSNSLQHGRYPLEVQVQRTNEGSHVLIEASDAAHTTSLTPRGEYSGLGIVDSLAARWGVVPTLAGKTVWAEVPEHG